MIWIVIKQNTNLKTLNFQNKFYNLKPIIYSRHILKIYKFIPIHNNQMNLFFTPPVYSYSLLASHHQACTIVEQLIATGCVQFELQAYDYNDPYNIIHSRVKTLKQKVQKMITLIETKYNQNIAELTRDEKILTIGKMKDYMFELSIDHLKYLDRKQYQIEEKFMKFTELTRVYDQFFDQVNRYHEEMQVCSIKAQTIRNKDFLSKQFALLTGSCLNKDKYMLQRLIFRKTHGHAYMMFAASPKFPDRSVFICFINQGIYRHIGPKVQQLFLLNKVNLYDLPNVEKLLDLHKLRLEKENQQLQKVLLISGQQLTETLRERFVGSRDNLRHEFVRLSYLERLLYIVCHSKKIGSPSNYIMFTVHMPADQSMPKLPASQIPIDQTQRTLKKRTILPRLQCLAQVNTLTELYSIPKHNELLPQIFMFSTVPILFGMMFSDFGHGLMLLVACIALKLSPIFYFMAFMSIYCGVIYNDFFGMKIIGCQELGILHGEWGAAQNGLNFQNSLKMKISMVIAFVHMSFGLVLKIVNQLKRSQTGLILYDSLPKLGLLFTTVGYLVFLIVKKWLTNFHGHQSTAPSIINSLLQLYLGWNEHRKHSILGSMETQKEVGQWLINLSVFFILVMVYNHTLRAKVECYWMEKAMFGGKGRKKAYKRIGERESYDDFEDQQIQERDEIQQISEQLVKEGQKMSNIGSKHLIEKQYYAQEDHHESQLGPLQVFQYILSLISSTTSYLRLFALSLAHAKLSHLLLTFLLGGLSSHQPNISFAKCLIFFMVTIGMMMVLDVMECMMHVVRLHWVEWMGKFYQGGGKLWTPEGQEKWE